MSVNDEHLHNRTLLVGPSFSGETYLELKTLSRIHHWDNFIITISPSEQSSCSQSKLKKLAIKFNL